MLVTENIMEVKDYLITVLSHTLTDINIIDGYSTSEYSDKLNLPKLCVCLSKVSAKKDGITGVVNTNFSADTTEETLGESINLRFSFYVYAPKTYTENDCNKIFIALCQTLLFDEQYLFSDIESDEINFDEKLQVFTGKITADLEIIYTRKKCYSAISSYEINSSAK